MDSEIRIIHIFNRMERGGAELRTIDLMEKSKNNYQFDFCSLSGMEGELDKEIRKCGGEVFYLKLKNLLFPVKFFKLLKNNNYRVVHSHVFYPSGYILLIARLAGVRKRIAHFRNSYDGKNKNLLRKIRDSILKKLIEKNATLILGVSQNVLKVAWEVNWVNNEKCKVIYNGINLRKFKELKSRDAKKEELELPKKSLVFINIGRMAVQKNQLRVVKIFKEIEEKEKNSFLLLVGKTNKDRLEEIKKYLNQKKLSEKVFVLGERNDIPELLKCSDVMIFPSKWEGLPGVVLESVAANTPVVASELPEIKEIQEKIEGVETISLEKSNCEWAKKVLDQVAQKGNSGISISIKGSDFDLEKCVKQFKRIYFG